MVRNPMQNYVEMPTKENMTMVVDDNNPTPFTPVMPSKPNKKAKPNPSKVNKEMSMKQTSASHSLTPVIPVANST